MSPKEKAEELFDKFYYIIPSFELPIDFIVAKECALIAVDYLINEQTMWQNGEPYPVLYWQEVKQEIIKL